VEVLGRDLGNHAKVSFRSADVINQTVSRTLPSSNDLVAQGTALCFCRTKRWPLLNSRDKMDRPWEARWPTLSRLS
jgi:hypothetical protein